MALPDGIDARTIIEDVRARHTAVLQLIYFTDTQATALLRIYVLVGVAAGSGAASILGNMTAAPRAAGWALALAAITAAIGAALCMRAMAPADVGFPGREAGFWEWTLTGPQMTAEAALKSYLARAKEKLAQNYTVNARGSRALTQAKWFMLAVPIIPVIAATAAVYWKI